MSEIYRWAHKPPPIFSFASTEKFPEFLRKGVTREEREGGRVGGMPIDPFARGSVRSVHDIRYPIIGMELEFELPTREKIEEKIWSRMTQISDIGAYLKTDSSIQNGLELVTHPKSLKKWIELRPQIEKLLDDLREDGYRSYQSGRCGLHFHISLSSFFSMLHAFRFMSFFMNNTKFCRKISGRNKEQYDQFCFGSKRYGDQRRFFLRNIEKYYPSVAKSVYRKVNSRRSLNTLYENLGKPDMGISEHHAAANITQYTIEIRIFRGTLNAEKVYSILEFIESVRQFTAERASFAESAIEYINWIDRKKEYKLCKTVFLKKFFSASEEKNNKHRKDLEKDAEKKDVIDKKTVDEYISKRNTDEINLLLGKMKEVLYRAWAANFLEDRHHTACINSFREQMTSISTSYIRNHFAAILHDLFLFDMVNVPTVGLLKHIFHKLVDGMTCTSLHQSILGNGAPFTCTIGPGITRTDFERMVGDWIEEYGVTVGLRLQAADRLALRAAILTALHFMYGMHIVTFWLMNDLYATNTYITDQLGDKYTDEFYLIKNRTLAQFMMLFEALGPKKSRLFSQEELSKMKDALQETVKNSKVKTRMPTTNTMAGRSTWILNMFVNICLYLERNISGEEIRSSIHRTRELLRTPADHGDRPAARVVVGNNEIAPQLDADEAAVRVEVDAFRRRANEAFRVAFAARNDDIVNPGAIEPIPHEENN